MDLYCKPRFITFTFTVKNKNTDNFISGLKGSDMILVHS